MIALESCLLSRSPHRLVLTLVHLYPTSAPPLSRALTSAIPTPYLRPSRALNLHHNLCALPLSLPLLLPLSYLHVLPLFVGASSMMILCQVTTSDDLFRNYGHVLD